MCLGGWEAATCPSGSIWEGSLVLPSMHAHRPCREHTVGLCLGSWSGRGPAASIPSVVPCSSHQCLLYPHPSPFVLLFLRSYVQSGVWPELEVLALPYCLGWKSQACLLGLKEPLASPESRPAWTTLVLIASLDSWSFFKCWGGVMRKKKNVLSMSSLFCVPLRPSV